MDVGVHAHSDTRADIPVDQVAAVIGEDIANIRAMPRGEAVEKISQAAATYLKHRRLAPCIWKCCVGPFSHMVILSHPH